jgi:hypothetical protein
MKTKHIPFMTSLAIISLLIYPTYASFNEFGKSQSSSPAPEISTPHDPIEKISKKAVLDQAISYCQEFIDFEEENLSLAFKNE